MLQLKFNQAKLTSQELHDIEKNIIQKQSTRATRNSMAEVNVLQMKTTDLLAHVLSLFIQINAHQILGLTLSQLLDLILDVAEGYHFFPAITAASSSVDYSEAPLPSYHTFYHAADVMTMLHYFCDDLHANEFLTEMDRVCLMVAALCHDIGHPGFNNHYQELMNTELLKKFGKKSTLEAYSVHLTIKLLDKHRVYDSGTYGGNSTLRHVAPLSKQKFFETIENLILSTDMMHHSSLETQLHQLSAAIAKQRKKPSGKHNFAAHRTTATNPTATTAITALTKKRTFATAFCLPSLRKRTSQQQAAEKAGAHIPANPLILDEESRSSLLQILLHAADISNMTRPWSIAKQWSDLVVQEFFVQGDEEKKHQKTVSPGMDRHSSDQASVSLQFESYIRPFFQALTHVLPRSYILVDYLASNRIIWEAAKETERSLKKRKLSLLMHAHRKAPPSNNNQQQQQQQHKRSSIVPSSDTTATNKRLLGYRSHSYPTSVLYNTPVFLEKNNMLPILDFNPPSCLYDNTNANPPHSTTSTTTSIVLYHPYDI